MSAPRLSRPRGGGEHVAPARGRSRSLLTRVALGAAASAVLAALVAAIVTSTFAVYLVQSAEDRRVMDAAVVLAGELDEQPGAGHDVAAIVADEMREMRHTGITFAVFALAGGQWLAGDPDIPRLPGIGCAVSEQLHACSTSSATGYRVVSATARTDISTLLAFSAALAALLAGLGAWFASRPIAGLLIGPLSALRERVGSIDVARGNPADLGPAVGMVEVDALRDTISALLARIGDAVRHAERFAADAAHELRTPLTSLRGELELLSEDASLTPTTSDDLGRAKQKVIDLQSLVERLLILALPDQSQWSASELVSLQDLLEDSIAQLSAPERARISLLPARGDVVVRGDAALLGTLFSNAVCNALKYGYHARVAAFESGPDVVLRIDDDGPGLPPEERERVFEPFVRSPLARQRRVPGHGLGLALILHIARRHGGDVKFVDGSPGAHLEVRLPRLAAKAAQCT
jgi:two-component system OmpR family sensor kinase